MFGHVGQCVVDVLSYSIDVLVVGAKVRSVTLSVTIKRMYTNETVRDAVVTCVQISGDEVVEDDKKKPPKKRKKSTPDSAATNGSGSTVPHSIPLQLILDLDLEVCQMAS